MISELTPEIDILVVAGVVPRKHVRRHRLLVEGGDELDRFDRLLAVERDFLAGLVLNGAAIAPHQAAPGGVRIVAVAERNPDRIALGLQLRAADPYVVPGLRLDPDLVPQALAIHDREVDVVVGKCRPGLVVLVVADLSADDADLAVLLLDRLDQARHVDKEFAIEVRAAGAVPPEQIVPRSGRRLGGRARGDVLHGDVVDGDVDIILLSPILGEVVEPFVVRRNEMAPLHDRQRLGVGQRPRHEWRGKHWCGAGGGKGEARFLQEPASRDMRNSALCSSSAPPLLASVG